MKFRRLAWGSEATKNASANLEGAKRQSSPAGLVWRDTKGLARLVYIIKTGQCACLSVKRKTVLDRKAWDKEVT